MTTRRATLHQLGEFGLIGRLAQFLREPADSVLTGIGDDAAVLVSPRGNSQLLFTTDALVERVHFDLRWDRPRDIGWKALVANLSDIAAMNGTPNSAVVAIGLPPRTPSSVVSELYKGLHTAGRTFATPIVGGDTVRSPRGIFISIAVLGSAIQKEITLRSAAETGDGIYVTGELGTCAAALHVVRQNHAIRTPLFRKHHHPVPRFDVLARLRRAKIPIRSMIDISDGLVADLQHVADASGVCCEIDPSLVPVQPGLRILARTLRTPLNRWTMNSGEEYELVMTISPRHAAHAAQIPGLTRIGRVTDGAGVVDSSGATQVQIRAGGFKHF